MKPETYNLYSKYIYFLKLVSDERLTLFLKNEQEIDFESFFDYYNYSICLHWNIKPKWKEYRKRRNQIIKKFEYGKYEILLRSEFCCDIKNIILSYIL